MKITMVIPSYWGRKKADGWRQTDAVYDHPTPLDEEGTLGRILDSMSILRNTNFNCVILGVATAEDIQKDVEQKLSSIIQESNMAIPTRLYSYSQQNIVHRHLGQNNLDDLVGLVQLDGYSNVRNQCVLLPHLLGSEIAVLIDDDEIFEDPDFMDKAQEFIGKTIDGERILCVAGYYINPDNDFFLNRDVQPWMTYWNKIDCMNRAFSEIIATEPRLKATPFAFGGNLVIHRDLFTKIPFDPSVPRGEDIDFLINARMFGTTTYLDNTLAIKHDAPPKTYPVWRRVREDILRFVFEKNKLDAQEDIPGMNRVPPEDLDPYPGEFLKEDLEEKIFRSNQMLAVDYLIQGERQGALECLDNIAIASDRFKPETDPFQNLLDLQKKWARLMEYFSAERTAQEMCSLCALPRD
jgi:hypothetical protein